MAALMKWDILSCTCMARRSSLDNSCARVHSTRYVVWAGRSCSEISHLWVQRPRHDEHGSFGPRPSFHIRRIGVDTDFGKYLWVNCHSSSDTQLAHDHAHLTCSSQGAYSSSYKSYLEVQYSSSHHTLLTPCNGRCVLEYSSSARGLRHEVDHRASRRWLRPGRVEHVKGEESAHIPRVIHQIHRSET